MKIQQFLEHHGIQRNPFAEEDAQTDPVFKEHCIDDTYHPTWDKIYGNPADPATAIVFGEKGAGKTALRLQIARHLAEHNAKHPDGRIFIVEYDDFNPFMDRFRDKLSPRKRSAERLLGQWKLWDHMDAILSLAVTRLVDRILEVKAPTKSADDDEPVHIEALDRLQARDLLLLAACYDHSLSESFYHRWNRLRKKLRFHTWWTLWPLVLGIVVTLLSVGMFAYFDWRSFGTFWPYVAVAAGWLPWLWQTWKCYWKARGVSRQVRVVHHEPSALRKVLQQFKTDEIAGQPLPNKERTDDRYELLVKLQGILRSLGYAGIIVLVDRVDEPHLINGASERMKTLVWPLLDNKVLKHPGVGFKLLLPIELNHYIEREGREFYQRARLDKQNMVPSLGWTGEALYDVANSRLKACAGNGRTPNLRSLFDDSISDERLIDAFAQLRVPRHLFKFLYRLMVEHSNAYTEASPVWTIPRERFESALALYRRDQDAFDRGVGAG